MPNRDELITALAQLDPAAFEDVVNSPFRQREDARGMTIEAVPDPGATPQEYAHWIAKRHLSSDSALEKVVYLPAGSPPDEVRLLEVNRFLNPPFPDAVEPLDFSPDTDPPLRVFVADITSDQWERSRQSPASLLPEGWDINGYEMIGR